MVVEFLHIINIMYFLVIQLWWNREGKENGKKEIIPLIVWNKFSPTNETTLNKSKIGKLRIMKLYCRKTWWTGKWKMGECVLAQESYQKEVRAPLPHIMSIYMKRLLARHAFASFLCSNKHIWPQKW